MSNPRYDGKPMLRLTELWVMRAIGELPSDEEQRLAELEPGLQKAWSLDGSWHTMIEQTLQLKPELAVELKRMWERNLIAAQNAGDSPPVEYFCQSIADQITS